MCGHLLTLTGQVVENGPLVVADDGVVHCPREVEARRDLKLERLPGSARWVCSLRRHVVA